MSWNNNDVQQFCEVGRIVSIDSNFDRKTNASVLLLAKALGGFFRLTVPPSCGDHALSLMHGRIKIISGVPFRNEGILSPIKKLISR